MVSSYLKRHAHVPGAARRLGPLAATAAAAAMLLTGAANSQAARVAKSSPCSAVSASSVSAIVGYKVPSPTSMVNDLKATKTNNEISSVDTSCIYGAETSLKSLKTLVLLNVGVSSKAITAAELAASLKTQQKTTGTLAFKIVSYSGLGVSGLYYSALESGFYFQGIAGVSGTHEFGAAVYSKTVSKSKLAALAKLAEKI